jgi:hypothetical protein
MDLTNRIIFIASLLTALGVITATAIKIYKFIRKGEDWIKEQSEHSKENYLSIQRLIIMSREMPLSERIAAGDKYTRLGGNGEIKKKYEELLEIFAKEHKE